MPGQTKRKMRLNRKRGLALAATALLLVLALAAAVWGADGGDGMKLYLKHCSACHGARGKGDGVVSQAMRPYPTDLTHLARAAGGTFSTADIAARIDGRETSRVHGEPDMPVWGEILRSSEGESGAASKVILITEYLKDIQEK